MHSLPQRELPEPGKCRKLGGVGLGLRWEFLEEVLDGPKHDVAFFEVSPENYLGRGGYYPSALERIAERYPIVTHGLTLSLGAIDEPDPRYLNALRAVFPAIGISRINSECVIDTAMAGRAAIDQSRTERGQ